jgi:hypothetical protein
MEGGKMRISFTRVEGEFASVEDASKVIQAIFAGQDVRTEVVDFQPQAASIELTKAIAAPAIPPKRRKKAAAATDSGTRTLCLEAIDLAPATSGQIANYISKRTKEKVTVVSPRVWTMMKALYDEGLVKKVVDPEDSRCRYQKI